jgi:6-phosphogluconolactonase
MTALRFTLAGLLAPLAFGANYLMYVGTYTNGGKSKGIYAFKFDTATGQASPLGLAAETPDPSFLTIHQNRKYLYAVGEGRGGSVTAFAIDAATGKLKQLNSVSSKGSSPCHLNVDKTGKNLLVVNYGNGSTSVFPINDDGSLKEASTTIQHQGSSTDKSRQQGPHAHSVNMSPDNRFAIVADLGLDEVKVYKFDPAASKIEPNEPPFARVAPGSGPRHFAFHPKGRNAYVINEMAMTITAFKWDGKKGVLTETQTISTLPPGFNGSRRGLSTAEVVVHPTGKFVYGSNRGHDTIAVYQVKGDKLEYVENVGTQGKTPRNFVVDPSGQYLLAENSGSDNVVFFKIDQKTGKLTPTGTKVEVGSPVCIRFMPM